MKKLILLAFALFAFATGVRADTPIPTLPPPTTYYCEYSLQYYGGANAYLAYGGSGANDWAWAAGAGQLLDSSILIYPGGAKDGTYSFTTSEANFTTSVTVAGGLIVGTNAGTYGSPFTWNQATSTFTATNPGNRVPAYYGVGSLYQANPPHGFLLGAPLVYSPRWQSTSTGVFPPPQQYTCAPMSVTTLTPGMIAVTPPVANVTTSNVGYPVRNSLGAIIFLNSVNAATTNTERSRHPSLDTNTLVADPVDTVTGAHFLSESPLGIMGSIPWNFTVSYSSKATAYAGFAAGWSHNFEARVTSNSTTRVDVKWSHMETVSYYPTSTAGATQFVAVVDGHQGEFLTRNADGSVTVAFDPKNNVVFASDGLIATITRGASSVTINHTTLTHPVAGNQVLPSRVTDTLTGVFMDVTYISGPDAFHPSIVTTNDGRIATFVYDSSGRVLQITGANGSWISYTYSTTTPLIAAGFRSDGSQIFANTFDATGRVLTQQDGRGATTTFAYNNTDPTAPYTDVTDRTGNTVAYFYDDNLRLLEKQQIGGYAVGYGYDGKGFCNRVTDTYGCTSTVAYTPSGDVTSSIGTDGATTTNTYDANRNLTSTTVPQGGQYKIAYNANNDPISITDPYGGVTQLQYAQPHLPSSVTNAQSATASITYTNGRVATKTDGAGNVTQFAYNAMGLPSTVTNAAGGVTTFTYDAEGQTTGVVLPDLTTKTFTYNARGRLASETDQLGKTTSLSYDANNNVTSVTNALSQTTTFGYDAEDRLKTVTNPLGFQTTLNYNAAGQILSAVDATGVTLTYQRDAGGRVTGILDGKGVLQASYLYDTGGHRTTTTDANGRITQTLYNTQGDLARVTDALGYSKWLFYDGAGALSSVSLASGLGTSQQHDVAGNVAATFNPAGQMTGLNHFTDGLPSDVTTALGKNTAFEYDVLNLLCSITRPSGATTTIVHNSMGQTTSVTDTIGTIGYAYDARGAISTITEGPQTIGRQYDDLGRMISYTDGAGNQVGYAYDAAGRMTALTYPGGKVVSYGYDAAGRMTSVTDWAGRVTTYAYDAKGQLSSVTNANGTSTTYTHGADHSLTSLQHFTTGGSLLASNAFTYDALGRVATDSRSPDFAGAAFDIPVAMTFDADNRLASYAGTPVTNDADGNMTLGPTGTSPPVLASYTYDARRRLTAHNGYTYCYDAENRRTSVTTAAGTSTYVFNPLPSLDQVLMRTGSGGTITYYVYGLGLIGEETGGVFTTYHFDRLGSTVAQTDQNGILIGRVCYTAFGGIAYQDASVQTPFLFCGEYGVQTDGNGLEYMRARYYNPQARRFVNQDVLLGSIADPMSMNRFAYANGDPISLIDPFGLAGEKPPMFFEWTGGWVTKLAAAAKANVDKSCLGWYPIGLLNNGIDAVAGILLFPTTLEHLGNGSGAFSVDPNWENGWAAAGDALIVVSTVLPEVAPLSRPTAVVPSRFFASTRVEVDALMQQGLSRSEAFAQIRSFNAGNTDGYLFHFTDIKGGQGIVGDSALRATQNGLGGTGVYVGTTPTPNFFQRYFSPAGWGIDPGSNVRIPLRITPAIRDVTRTPLLPRWTRVIGSGENIPFQ